MAKRLRTRLSAGAALVTGIGMMGIATAVPAHAAETLQYTCTTGDLGAGSQTFDFTFATDAPDEATVGEELSITPSGSLTLGQEAVTALQGADITSFEGTLTDVVSGISDGSNSGEVTTDLAFPKTEISTEPVPLSGQAMAVTAEQPGEYTISAPKSFSATVTGYDEQDAAVGEPASLKCTTDAEQVINTITVTEDDGGDDGDDGDDGTGEEPVEANDWFTEPPSLPLVDNTFTIEGEATQAGVITVEVLSGVPGEDGESTPGEVLKTYTMNATEGANKAEYDLVEGADYVRLVSQDCVDEAGNDETVAGGCNVTYKAPWAEDGNNDNDDAGDDAGEKVTDDAPAEPAAPADPQVPQVVQTDGLTPATTPQDDNTAAFALGGLLLAGAGAGTVLVARRRAAQH